MKRRIIKIDSEKCNGCGLCAKACHEGAIEMRDGKAVLIKDDYCDGLGDCLPVCEAGAITFEEREAAAYDEAAVKVRMAEKNKAPNKLACGCPSTDAKTFERREKLAVENSHARSELRQFPVQIQLVPTSAPYFEGAELLVAADCTAFAYGNFHADFIRGRITLIGCPKLDEADYAEKLTAILSENDIKSLTIVRMEVPCCGGLEHAAKTALKNSGKFIPWSIVVISRDGKIIR